MSTESARTVIAYTLSEAARTLGLSPTQVHRLLGAGKLQDTTLVAGSGRYITADSVHRYAKERQAQKG